MSTFTSAVQRLLKITKRCKKSLKPRFYKLKNVYKRLLQRCLTFCGDTRSYSRLWELHHMHVNLCSMRHWNTLDTIRRGCLFLVTLYTLWLLTYRHYSHWLVAVDISIYTQLDCLSSRCLAHFYYQFRIYKVYALVLRFYFLHV